MGLLFCRGEEVVGGGKFSTGDTILRQHSGRGVFLAVSPPGRLRRFGVPLHWASTAPARRPPPPGSPAGSAAPALPCPALPPPLRASPRRSAGAGPAPGTAPRPAPAGWSRAAPLKGCGLRRGKSAIGYGCCCAAVMWSLGELGLDACCAA